MITIAHDQINPNRKKMLTSALEKYCILELSIHALLYSSQSNKNKRIVDCKGTAEHLNYYRPLFHAAERGDCKTAKSFIDNDPRALIAEISIHLGTVLHIAAHCCQWKFVLMLLELDVSTPQSIAKKNAPRATVLHYVAEGGSLKTAEALVEKNADLPQMVDNKGYLPLLYSISSESKELVRYLSLKTRVESPNFPYFIPELPVILHTLIQAG